MARIKSSLVTGLAAAMGSYEFVVVELTKDGPRPVYDAYGQLVKFSTGEAASEKARQMTTVGRKFQPRRVKDDAWHEREAERFKTKEYKPLPWAEAVWWKAHKHIWGEHYPHVSQKNSVGLMAYTESEDTGSADMQTPIKPGKYLERHFSSVLDPFIIRDLCTVFSNVFEENCLLFADSEDEFESFYTTGPSSCMSHPADKYTSHIHPVRVYAAGDLALVYMKRDGRIVARALCWPEKKIYSRVYGDSGRIEPLLSKEGYKKGPPVGAKLQRVLTWENKKAKSGQQAFVAPHIDDVSYVMDCGDHLLVGGAPKELGKRVNLSGAAGVTEWVSVRCKCGKEAPNSQLTRVYVTDEANEERWCQECVKTDAFMDNNAGRYVANKLAVVMYDGSKWWRRVFRAEGFTCAGSSLNYPNSQRMIIKNNDGVGVKVSKAWYHEHGVKCPTCTSPSMGNCSMACKDSFTRCEARAAKATAAGYSGVDAWVDLSISVR